MSVWSVLGKVGSTVGKVALGAVGTATGVDGLANAFDSKPSAASAVQTASASSLTMQPVDPAIMANTPVTITADRINGLPSWLLPAGLAAGGVLFLALIFNKK
ncbi:MAG TPA: hypothetical protein VHA56_03160 [Mucilaginibacter sp.]|nr:hypothetical protein [Mucilaginibacter sp.]